MTDFKDKMCEKETQRCYKLFFIHCPRPKSSIMSDETSEVSVVQLVWFQSMIKNDSKYSYTSMNVSCFFIRFDFIFFKFNLSICMFSSSCFFMFTDCEFCFFVSFVIVAWFWKCCFSYVVLTFYIFMFLWQLQLYSLCFTFFFIFFIIFIAIFHVLIVVLHVFFMFSLAQLHIVFFLVFH